MNTLADADDGERSLGDALLSLAGAARMMDVDPEIALNRAVDRLIARFAAIEAEIRGEGLDFSDLSAERLRKYWDSVKL